MTSGLAFVSINNVSSGSHYDDDDERHKFCSKGEDRLTNYSLGK